MDLYHGLIYPGFNRIWDDMGIMLMVHLDKLLSITYLNTFSRFKQHEEQVIPIDQVQYCRESCAQESNLIVCQSGHLQIW